jgi:tetratricopeptide (TPR) repeat protein
MPSVVHDVFVSYRHSDAEPAGLLVSALEAQGLNVWFDRSSVDDFGSISEAARTGLTDSKAMVVFYSAGYPHSSPCQWELTQGFVAAMRLGDPRRRVLVVNPEPGSSHIEPVELRDALYATLDADRTFGFDAMAQKIAAHVAMIDSELGAGISQPAIWLPSHPPAATRFAGRFKQMWQVHSAIHAHEQAMTQGAVGPGACQVRGLGGVGKSLLAREYALRYQASFPGGVFWLYAQGDVTSADGTAERETLRLNQIRGFAPAVLGPGLAVGIDSLSLPDVEAALRNSLSKKSERYLWVVDDLPEGLSAEEIYRWIGPPGACTIVTTRSNEYGALMPEVILGVLEPDEALSVLVARKEPADAQEFEAARRVVTELGGHALAIDVAGATLRFQSFSELLEHLLDSTTDELELAAALKEELPTGRERSITSTLSRSLDRLGPEANDLLRLASMLARDPIPKSLIDMTFQSAGDLDTRRARVMSMVALDEAMSLSLIEPAEEETWRIHPLVAKTVALKETDSSRLSALRSGSVRSLLGFFSDRREPGPSEEIRRLVGHARWLVREPDNAEEADLASLVAIYDLEVGDYKAARVIQEAQVSSLNRLLGPRDPKTLAATARLAETLRILSELQLSKEMLEDVVVAEREVLGPDHRETLYAIGELGKTLFLLDDPRRAKSLAEEVLAGRLATLGPEHPDALRASSDLAIALDSLGDSTEAKALIDDAVASYRRVLGSRHPDTLKAMTLQGVIASSAGDPEAARRIGEELLATRREVLGDLHPDTLLAMNNLAYSLWGLGELDEALSLAGRALEREKELFGIEHLSTLCTMDTLSCILRDRGDPEAARALGEEAFETSRRVLGEHNDDTLVLMTNLIETLKACGDDRSARDLARRAVVLSTDALGENHPITQSAIAALTGLQVN